MLGRRNNPATLVSSLYLLRGRAYEELDNRERAIEWYTKALVANVSCVEAFNRLIEQRMLSSEQEQTLLLDLPWVPDDRWLCLMYQSKIMTYQGEVEEEKEQTEQTEQKVLLLLLLLLLLLPHVCIILILLHLLHCN